jgi:hypothetical protein
VEEVLGAIDRLRLDPPLYRRMVERGRERAVEFSPAVILDRWIDLLWHRLPALTDDRPWQSFPPWLRPALRKASQLWEGRPDR